MFRLMVLSGLLICVISHHYEYGSALSDQMDNIGDSNASPRNDLASNYRNGKLKGKSNGIAQPYIPSGKKYEIYFNYVIEKNECNDVGSYKYVLDNDGLDKCINECEKRINCNAFLHYIQSKTCYFLECPNRPLTFNLILKHNTYIFKQGSRIQCGIKTTAKTRIVGGNEVYPRRKYSWQVGLTKSKSKISYFCGGSIITDKHILTAAHCFYEYPNHPSNNGCFEKTINHDLYVGVGDHDQKEPNGRFGEPILASKFVPHYKYKCDNKYFLDDIAVIVLTQSLNLETNANVLHPVCLPNPSSGTYKTYLGDKATVSGWGSTIRYPPGTVNPSFNLPDKLQETRLHVLECVLHSSATLDPNTQLCAGFLKGEKPRGTCQGDSGGPLTVDENGRYVQIGVVGGGAGCAWLGDATFYARVTYYLHWIKLKVGSETLYYES